MQAIAEKDSGKDLSGDVPIAGSSCHTDKSNGKEGVVKGLRGVRKVVGEFGRS